jgi:hypothetical protein
MNGASIAESLELFSHPDFINDYKIDGRPVDVPRHLIVQLKRFEFECRTWTRHKVKTTFQFPVGLHLKETDFVLQGGIVHKRSSEAGNYYSYVRESGDGWLCFNDTHVSHVTQQNVLKEGKDCVKNVDVKALVAPDDAVRADESVWKALMGGEEIEDADEVLALVESARRVAVSANAEGTADDRFDEMEKENAITAGFKCWSRREGSKDGVRPIAKLLAFGGGKLDNSGERQCRR